MVRRISSVIALLLAPMFGNVSFAQIDLSNIPSCADPRIAQKAEIAWREFLTADHPEVEISNFNLNWRTMRTTNFIPPGTVVCAAITTFQVTANGRVGNVFAKQANYYVSFGPNKDINVVLPH